MTCQKLESLVSMLEGLVHTRYGRMEVITTDGHCG